MEQMIKEFENKIIQHDTSKTFPLPDECVDVCITSPPYWGLRDYGENVYTIWDGRPDCKHEWGLHIPPKGSKSGKHGPKSTIGAKIGQDTARRGSGSNFCQLCGAWKGQLGLEPHPQMYIDHLVQVAREIKRVLKKSGSFYLNLGDTYFGGGQGGGDYGGKEVCPKSNYGHIKTKSDGSWLQPKQLMFIPMRVAIALQEDGWILRNDIIWRKPNAMPSSVKDRLNNTYEHLFHFVKARKYYYDLDGIRVPHKEGVTRWGGNIMKPAKNTKYTTDDRKTIYCRINEDRIWRNPKGKNPGDVLDVTTKGYKEAHFAVFPLKLIDQPLKATLPIEICRKCGKPRMRIIKTNNPSKKHADKDGLVDANKIQKTSNPQSVKSLHRNTSSDGKTKGVYYSGVTIGWTDCGCNAGFDVGIVLDPFAGRGTVGKWCKENWGRYILFDIKPDYCEMANLYIGGQKRKIIDGQTKLTVKNKAIQ